MAVIEWVRFLAGTALLVSGLIIFAIEMIGGCINLRHMQFLLII